MERGTSLLTILGPAAVIIFAVIRVWNTRQRRRLEAAGRARREGEDLERQVKSLATERTLLELEARLVELAESYEAKQWSTDVRLLQDNAFR